MHQRLGIRSLLFAVSLIVGVLALARCSSSSSDSGSSSAPATGVGTGIAKVQANVASANIVNYTSTSSLPGITTQMVQPSDSVHILSAGVMATSDWTTINANIINMVCGGPPNNCNGGSGSSSPAYWVKNMLSPTFTNGNGVPVGLMGRFLSAVGQACFLGSMMGSSMPAAGSITITVTQPALDAGNALCGTTVNASDLGSLPATVSGTVYDTSTTGAGMFDRKIVLNVGGQSQAIFIKNDGVISRVMTTQTQTQTDNSGNPYPYLNRYVAEYNASTGVARFEGLERGFPVEDGAGTGFYFYRIWVNSLTKEVRVMGQNGGQTCSVTNSASTTCPSADLVSGTATMMGLSGAIGTADATIEIAGTASGASTPAAFDKIGCVNMSTNVVDAANQDGTGACNGRAMNLTAAGGAYSVVNTTASQLALASWKTDETISLFSFTDTTIFTAAPTN